MYLANDLYKGFVRLQADRGLGRSYAALLPFVEGLYSLGYISQEVYDVYAKRYSQPLEGRVAQKLDEVAERIEKLNTVLGGVVAQWDMHPEDGWRQKWFKIAKRHSELENAKLLLQKIEEVS